MTIDLTQDQSAMVTENIRLAYYFARRCFDLDPHEALSAAMEGLAFAAMKFNPERCSFAGFASLYIRWNLNKYRRLRIAKTNVNRLVSHSIDEPVNSQFDGPNMSIRCVLKDDSSPSALDYLCHDADASMLNAAIAKLPAKMQTMVKMRFGLDNFEEHTLQAIADQFGTSRQYIEQVLDKALGRLKKNLPAEAKPGRRNFHKPIAGKDLNRALITMRVNQMVGA
jgi:RNA polymerase sigma factor (sigma-70 family)